MIQEILHSSASAPVFLDCRAVSSTEISFRFSEPVRMVSFNLDPGAEMLSCRDGEEVLVTLAQPLGTGVRITADILVEDEHRNTLNVLVPFRSKNERPPLLLINEIRTAGTNVNNPKTAKVEFIEFYSKSAGNLGSLRLYAASYSLTQPVYEFNPVEVKAGEYIVLHLRTPSADCVDETTADLAVSGGNDALPIARDLWVPGSQKTVHDTDAIYLADQDGHIIDAVLLCEVSGNSWNKAYMAEAAALFAAQGVWLPAGGLEPAAGTYTLTASDAVYSVPATATKTFNRDESLEKGGRPENWYITTSSNNSPGKSNSTNRDSPKP